jgi:GNAT superfamily N-acetyltransferase
MRYSDLIIEAKHLAHTEADDAALEQRMQSLYNTPREAPRKLHLVDLGRIGRLDVATTHWPPAFRTFFFFMVDGEPIGFATLQRGGRAMEGEQFTITLIYLRPAFRQQGFATAFYRLLMGKGIALQPDTMQTAGGAAVWRKLGNPS